MIEKTDLKPIQGIPELLEQLKRDGVLTAIASSSSRDFISLVVDRTGIRQYFDAFISGQELPESKPNPAIYLLAAQTLGVEPSECIVLEDAHLGVEAAKRAGMRCIGYRNPNSGAQDLSKADVVVDRMEKIIRMIGTL
jgi:HAD superfamily hydrolase (TIGR01509 family)